MSEIVKICLLIIFNLSYSTFATTNFVHLIGYDILAEPPTTSSGVTDEDGCAEQCVTNTECIGFDYLNSDCTLLINVRNIVTNISACNFYIFDRTADTNFGDLDLTETDKLVYSNAYLNNSCPQGSTDDITQCSIAVTVKKGI
uniref:Apple domain-containing protein n=1 Tax=Panagrolaimus davidi TaxID=227884 RepID=A0A914Q312_9BILA